MPTYSYRCPTCEVVTDITHLMSDDTPRVCVTCDTNLVRKPMTDSRPTFKGEGFYTTDRFN